MNIDRARSIIRGFLRAADPFIDAATEIGKHLDDTIKTFKVVNSLWRAVRKATGFYSQEYLRSAFGTLDGYFGYAGGKLRAFGDVHPDNRAAAARLASLWPLLEIHSAGSLKICRADEITFGPGDNLLLVGGPVSNELSRYQFGYSGDFETLERRDESLGLYYSFYCNRTKCKTVTRRYIDGRVHEAPGYFIQPQRGAEISPERGANDFINEEYLLVSRTPNMIAFDDSAGLVQRGKNVLAFESLHGIGVRNIHLLLSDEDCLKKLAEAYRKKRYYQVLLMIPVKHDHVNRKSFPVHKRFEIIDIRPIKLSG